MTQLWYRVIRIYRPLCQIACPQFPRSGQCSSYWTLLSGPSSRLQTWAGRGLAFRPLLRKVHKQVGPLRQALIQLLCWIWQFQGFIGVKVTRLWRALESILSGHYDMPPQSAGPFRHATLDNRLWNHFFVSTCLKAVLDGGCGLRSISSKSASTTAPTMSSTARVTRSISKTHSMKDVVAPFTALTAFSVNTSSYYPPLCQLWMWLRAECALGRCM